MRAVCDTVGDSVATLTVRLARGFLLVCYCNRSHKMHRFQLGACDRQTDGRTAALLNASYHRSASGHSNIMGFFFFSGMHH